MPAPIDTLVKVAIAVRPFLETVEIVTVTAACGAKSYSPIAGASSEPGISHRPAAAAPGTVRGTSPSVFAVDCGSSVSCVTATPGPLAVTVVAKTSVMGT